MWPHGYVLLYWKRFKYMWAVIKKYLPLDKLDEVPASELCEPFFSNFPLDYKEINDIIFWRIHCDITITCIYSNMQNYLGLF